MPQRIYTMTAFTARPGHESDMIDLWAEAASLTLELVPGALMGEIMQDPANPRRLVALDVWRDHAAFDQWRRLPEYLRYTEHSLRFCEEIERRTLTVMARATRTGEE